MTNSGKPYLESHHITQLADDGPDAPKDVVASCPTCHRKIHHGVDGPSINKVAHDRIRLVEKAINDKRLKVVTAAVILDESNRVLIAQRRHGKQLGLKWEFPGGKVEVGETLEVCLVREILEEMDIVIKVTRRFYMVDYKYPDFDIRLCAMKAEIVEGQLHLNDHEKVIWVNLKDFLSMDLAPADQHIARALINASDDVVQL